MVLSLAVSLPWFQTCSLPLKVFEGQSVKDLHYLESPEEGKGQNNNCKVVGQFVKIKLHPQLTHTCTCTNHRSALPRCV